MWLSQEDAEAQAAQSVGITIHSGQYQSKAGQANSIAIQRSVPELCGILVAGSQVPSQGGLDCTFAWTMYCIDASCKFHSRE